MNLLADLANLTTILMFLRANRRELYLLALLTLAFCAINPGMQYLFPEAGMLDWSFLTLIVAGLFKAVVIGVFTWLMLAIFAPTTSQYLDSGKFEEDYQNLPPQLRLRGASITIVIILTLVTLCVLFG